MNVKFIILCLIGLLFQHNFVNLILENNSVLRKNYICFQFTSPCQSFPQSPMSENAEKKTIVRASHVLKVQLYTKLLTSTGVFVSPVRANLLTRPKYCYFTFHKDHLNNPLFKYYFVLSILNTFHTPKRHYRFSHYLHHYSHHRPTRPHNVGLGSVPDWSMWDFWWTNWLWNRFFYKYFGSSPSVISPVLIFHSYTNVKPM
jgi:hypothetical protein